MEGTDPRRKIGAASIGQFGEIYDFAVFGFSVPILAVHFFPASDPVSGILSTFAVYAVAFFARPLGGLAFGFLADKIGRVKVLAVTIWLMAGATAFIGALPTYSSIGIAAPTLLVLCRLLQGFAMGGETSGATSYILESAPDGRRGFWVGIIWFVAHLPNALVALMLVLLQLLAGSEAYFDWLWRVPFLVGGLVGVVGFWMRRNLEDPKEYRDAKQSSDSAKLRSDRRAGIKSMIYVLLIQPIQTVASYLLLGFMYTFLVRDAHLDSLSALISNALAMLIVAAMIPIGGALSDRIGRKFVLTVGAIWIACAAYPAILLAASGTFSGAMLGQLLVAVGLGLYGGATFVAAVEFFPTTFRATGHAVAYQLAVAIFGGTTPLVAAWLVGHFATPIAPAYYVIAIAVMCAVAVQFVPETKNVSLRTAAANKQPGGDHADDQSGIFVRTLR